MAAPKATVRPAIAIRKRIQASFSIWNDCNKLSAFASESQAL
jgi:hypothetical protein